MDITMEKIINEINDLDPEQTRVSFHVNTQEVEEIRERIYNHLLGQ